MTCLTLIHDLSTGVVCVSREIQQVQLVRQESITPTLVGFALLKLYIFVLLFKSPFAFFLWSLQALKVRDFKLLCLSQLCGLKE